MKLNTEKKILSSDKNPKHKVLFGVVLISLFVFLSGFFIPLNKTFAQSVNNRLVISADNLNFNTKETRIITAKTSSGTKTISFTSSPKSGTFSPDTCTTSGEVLASIWSCSVNFKSKSNGKTFNISASTTNNNSTLNSNKISIVNGNVFITPSLLISANKYTLKPNENSLITVVLDKGIGEETISFSASSLDSTSNMVFSSEGIFTPNTCIAVKSAHFNKPGCSVNFHSSIKKTFTINASVKVNNKTYFSPEISVKIANILTNSSTNKNNIDTKTTYTPLAPLPGLQKTIETNKKINSCPFGNYFNTIIKLIIGFAAVLAMVMIVAGGIEYMTSDLISSKESGKKTITNAIFGLLIALSAYLILNTINPKLLTICLDNLPTATITISPEANSAIVKTSGNCAVMSKGSCTLSKLSEFGDKAQNASKICNIESEGIPSKISTGDRCDDSNNTPFSFGLFQINVIANGDMIKTQDKESCSGLFVRSDGSEINKNDYIIYSDGKFNHYDCKLRAGKEALYKKCKDVLLDGVKNTDTAHNLFTRYGSPNIFQSWYYSDSKICSSAFQ